MGIAYGLNRPLEGRKKGIFMNEVAITRDFGTRPYTFTLTPEEIKQAHLAFVRAVAEEEVRSELDQNPDVPELDDDAYETLVEKSVTFFVENYQDEEYWNGFCGNISRAVRTALKEVTDNG